jgi:hypothetical protein
MDSLSLLRSPKKPPAHGCHGYRVESSGQVENATFSTPFATAPSTPPRPAACCSSFLQEEEEFLMEESSFFLGEVLAAIPFIWEEIPGTPKRDQVLSFPERTREDEEEAQGNDRVQPAPQNNSFEYRAEGSLQAIQAESGDRLRHGLPAPPRLQNLIKHNDMLQTSEYLSICSSEENSSSSTSCAKSPKLSRAPRRKCSSANPSLIRFLTLCARLFKNYDQGFKDSNVSSASTDQSLSLEAEFKDIVLPQVSEETSVSGRKHSMDRQDMISVLTRSEETLQSSVPRIPQTGLDKNSMNLKKKVRQVSATASLKLESKRLDARLGSSFFFFFGHRVPLKHKTTSSSIRSETPAP